MPEDVEERALAAAGSCTDGLDQDDDPSEDLFVHQAMRAFARLNMRTVFVSSCGGLAARMDRVRA